MSIYKFVGLAMFATVCFIGGFLTGEIASYSPKIAKDIVSTMFVYRDHTSEYLELIYETPELDSLIRITDGEDINTHIKIKKGFLSSTLKEFEDHSGDSSHMSREYLFKSAMERAKSVLDNEGT